MLSFLGYIWVVADTLGKVVPKTSFVLRGWTPFAYSLANIWTAVLNHHRSFSAVILIAVVSRDMQFDLRSRPLCVVLPEYDVSILDDIVLAL